MEFPALMRFKALFTRARSPSGEEAKKTGPGPRRKERGGLLFPCVFYSGGRRGLTGRYLEAESRLIRFFPRV